MRQGLSVIVGGRVADGVAVVPNGAKGAWRVDLRRALSVEPDEIAAWRALLIRIASPEPVYADPDYLLTAAIHESGGRDLVFAFAWNRKTGHERLCGVVPLAMPHGLWGKGRAQAWYPPGPVLAPSIEAASRGAVEAALREAVRAVHARATLVLTPTMVPSAVEREVAPTRPASRSAVPGRDRVGVRLVGPWSRIGVEIERVVEPRRIRDAVETFLAFDAQVSPAPIVGDPSASAMVRVVTRRFAERRQTGVEFARRDGVIIAAALRLGRGPGAVVWRQAGGAADSRRRGRG